VNGSEFFGSPEVPSRFHDRSDNPAAVLAAYDPEAVMLYFVQSERAGRLGRSCAREPSRQWVGFTRYSRSMPGWIAVKSFPLDASDGSDQVPARSAAVDLAFSIIPICCHCGHHFLVAGGWE